MFFYHAISILTSKPVHLVTTESIVFIRWAFSFFSPSCNFCLAGYYLNQMTSDVKVIDVIVEKMKNSDTALQPNTNGSNHPCSICLKKLHQNQKSKLSCQCEKLIPIKWNNILPREFEFPPGNWICLSCTSYNDVQIFHSS